MSTDFRVFFIKRRNKALHDNIFSGMQIFAAQILEEIPIYTGKD